MDTTFSHLKSHFISGYRKGTTKPPLAPSMWILMSQPFSLLSLPGSHVKHLLKRCHDAASPDGHHARHSALVPPTAWPTVGGEEAW